MEAAIAGAIGGLFNFLSITQRNKHGNLPDPINPTDFQRRSYTIELLIGGIVVIILVIVIAVAVIGVKKIK